MRVEVASHTRSLGQKLIGEKVILPVAGRAHTLRNARRIYAAAVVRRQHGKRHFSTPRRNQLIDPHSFRPWPLSFFRPADGASFHDMEKRLPGKTFRERVCVYVCLGLGAIVDGPRCRSGYSKKCCCLWRIDRSMASHGKLCRCAVRILFPPPLSLFLLLLLLRFFFFFLSLSLPRSTSMLVKIRTRIFMYVYSRNGIANFYNFLKNCKNEERFYYSFY